MAHGRWRSRGAAPVLATQIAWSAGGQIASVVAGLATVPLLLDRLGPAGFGAWSLVIVSLQLLTSLDGGLSAAMLRFFSVHKGADDAAAASRLLVTATAGAIGIGVVAGSLTTLGRGLLTRTFGPEAVPAADFSSAIGLVGWIVALPVLVNVLTAFLNAEGHFRLPAVANVVAQGTYLVALVLLVRAPADFSSLPIVLSAPFAIRVGVMLPACVRQLERRTLRFVTRAELRSLVAFGWRAQVVGVAALVNLQADAFIIGVLLPLRFVGYYAVASQFASLLRNVPLYAMPAITRRLGILRGRVTGEGGAASADLVTELRRVHRRWVVGVGGITAIGAVASAAGIRAWLGEEFALAALGTVVLAVGGGVNLLTGVLSAFGRVLGRPAMEARYSVVSVVVNLVLTPLGALTLGFVGVVLATAVAQVVGSLWFVRLLDRGLDVALPGLTEGMPWSRLLLCGGASAGAEVALLVLWPEAGLPGLLVAATIGGIALSAYAWLSRRELSSAVT